jgi:hypothetical protein
MYFFILGLVCPILVWLAARKWPNSILRYVSTPVIFGGTAYIPPATVMIYASWGFVGTMFNKGTSYSIVHKTHMLISIFSHQGSSPRLVDRVHLHYFCSFGLGNDHMRFTYILRSSTTRQSLTSSMVGWL